MANVLRAASFRIGLVGLVLGLSLSGCDAIGDIFGKSKTPLAGERIPVFAERSELEPDKDMANVQIVLPAPTVNDSWPQSGGFANYAMHNLAVSGEVLVVHLPLLLLEGFPIRSDVLAIRFEQSLNALVAVKHGCKTTKQQSRLFHRRFQRMTKYP